MKNPKFELKKLVKPTALLTLGFAFAPGLVPHAHPPMTGLMFVQLNHPLHEKKKEVRVHHARIPKMGREKPSRSLSNELYIYIYLKKKSGNANSTHLNKKLQPGLSRGRGQPRAGREAGRDHPHVLRHLAQPRLGCRLGTGERTAARLGTAVPGEETVRLRGGNGGHRGWERWAPRYSRDPEQQQVLKRGKRKTNSEDAGSCGVLFTLHRTPTSPAFCGKSGLESG